MNHAAISAEVDAASNRRDTLSGVECVVALDARLSVAMMFVVCVTVGTVSGWLGYLIVRGMIWESL